MSGPTPASSNLWQCGQLSAPISIRCTLAVGLPIMKPPAGVAITIFVQSPSAGGGTGLYTDADVSVGAASLTLLQAASGRSAMAAQMRVVDFIGSFAPNDLGKGCVVGAAERRRAAISRNLRRKRLQAQAELRVGDFAEPLAQFLGNGPELGA